MRIGPLASDIAMALLMTQSIKNRLEKQKHMKKYRCKIDSPWGNKGELAILDSEFNPWDIDPSRYKDIFEEIPDRWVPEIDENYYTIVMLGAEFFVDSSKWDNDRTDVARLTQNRVFSTHEKAQLVLDKILKLLEEEKEV